MTQERMPLAVMATALAEQVPRPPALAGVATPQSNDWWSAKKRKRTVACGQCDACCRNDCGTCLNCLDKPKFGGSGIRKQSCLERKCRQPMAAPTPGNGPLGGPSGPVTSAPAQQIAASMTKAAAIAAPPVAEARNSMAPQEFEAFWSAVECCMLLQGGHATAGAHAAMLEQMQEVRSAAKASAQRGRTNRCGSCAGCLRGDCGVCKNCRDKPKFGGKGIKKQACVRRACNNPLPDVAEDDDDLDDDDGEPLAKTARVLATGPGGFLSAAPSPPAGAAQPKGAVPPAFELGADAKARATASDGSCGMLQDTRRRLQQLRAANGATFEEGRPSSSMSTGYSTADEYEVDAEEPADDAGGSEHNSATEDVDEAEGGEGTSGEALLVALARSGA